MEEILEEVVLEPMKLVQVEMVVVVEQVILVIYN
jgi:hypothetical protein